MRVGENFWKLVCLVFLILGAYGLVILNDLVTEKSNLLDSQKKVLLKQRLLVENSAWVKNLAAVEPVRKAWLTYLPQDNSVALAKAHLLNAMRALAKDTGAMNLNVTATEVEVDAKNTLDNNIAIAQINHPSSLMKDQPEILPKSVHLIKLKVSGRFDPAAFSKLLRAIEDEGKFISIERVSVRGAQMELNLRYYWRNTLDKTASIVKKSDFSLIIETC